MRIVYYAHSHYLEPATLFSRAMSEFSVVHWLLELSSGSWRSAMFDMESVPLPVGVLPADAILSSHFPAQVRAYWSTIASFNLVLHNSKRTLHPAAWWTSQAMRFIRGLKPDILHLDDPDTSLRLALDIFEIGRIPLVLNVHDPTPHSGEHNWRKIAARTLIFPHVHHFVLHKKDQAEAFRRVNHVSHDRVSLLHLGSSAGGSCSESSRYVPARVGACSTKLKFCLHQSVSNHPAQGSDPDGAPNRERLDQPHDSRNGMSSICAAVSVPVDRSS